MRHRGLNALGEWWLESQTDIPRGLNTHNYTTLLFYSIQQLLSRRYLQLRNTCASSVGFATALDAASFHDLRLSRLFFFSR